jgi:hypothetical protein
MLHPLFQNTISKLIWKNVALAYIRKLLHSDILVCIRSCILINYRVKCKLCMFLDVYKYQTSRETPLSNKEIFFSKIL